MDDEINLRRYVLALWQHWRLIVALILIGGLAAGAVSLALPNLYEADALVSITAAHNTLRLDSVNQDPTLPVHAYPELAMSGDVIAAVFAKVAPLLPASVNTTSKFAAQLTAESASDPTLLRLKVRDTDPQRAAQIANMWAEVFAARAGELYAQDRANLVIYQQQLVDAKTRLDQADSDLAGFQASNQVGILSAQLDSGQASLTDYLNREHQLQLLTQDTQDLLDRLNNQPGTSPASPANDLELVSIISRIDGVQTSPTSTVQTQMALPIQLQLNTSQPLAGPTVADQKALADNLRSTITARLADMAKQVTALEPQILSLQGQAAQAQVKQAELTRAQKLAEDQYTQLAQQVQQANIAIQGNSSNIQIASRAAVPTVPVSPHRTVNVLLGLVTGLVLGALAALALELLRPAPAAVAQPAPQP